MDYRPRYSQPFTLEQATLLDTVIITEGRSNRMAFETLLIQNLNQR
jgi:hypothetical protein